MKLLLLGFLLAICTVGFGNKINYTNLTTAVTNRQVTVLSEANGGLGGNNLTCKIKNISDKAIYIQVPAGLYFKANNPEAQDLVTANQMLLALEPAAEKSINLTGFCTEASDYSPSAKALYSYAGYAPSFLKSLSDSLLKYPAIAQDYGQMFVWAVSDKRQLHDIWVEAKLIKPATNIMKYVADVTKQPYVKVTNGASAGGSTYSGPSVKVFSKEGLLAFQNPVSQVASVVMCDAAGEIKYVLFQNKRISHGLKQYICGINEIVPATEDPVYILKAIDSYGKTLAQMTLNKDTPEPVFNQETVGVVFSFNLEKAVKNVKLAVYLEDGSLIEEFQHYKYMPVGSYDFKLKFQHLLPANTKFIAKLEEETGKVVKEQVVK